MRRLLIATCFFAPFMIADFTAVPAFAQNAQEPMLGCLAKFHARAGVEGEFPGMLGGFKNRPCRLSAHINSVGAPTRGAKRIEFVVRPSHGKVSAKAATTFVLLPDRDFTGSDTMVVRYHFKSGKSATVRFAITVS